MTHPKHIEFNGYKFRLSGNYYRRNVWGSPGPSNLHRAVWEYHNGPIPEGYEIHHKDGDTFNNDIANLEMLDISEHQRMHALERVANGELAPPSEIALARAAEWHASEDGLAWHREHGKKSWGNRPWHDKACEVCGQGFRTPYPNKTKYCHKNCKQMALRIKRGQPVGTRPYRQKPRTLDGKRAPT